MPTRNRTSPLVEVTVRTRASWRSWLATHHDTSPGIWLVFYKGHTGKQSVAYEDAVREALCFGWIDSLIRRLDDDRYARKFTPRKPTSKWSDSNRKRWAELEAAGQLTKAGLRAAPTENAYGPLPILPEMTDDFAKALRAKPKAKRFFDSLRPSERRYFVGWVHLAKREETRQRRLKEALRLLAAGKKLGLK